MAERGWYDDPYGAFAQRWFDGAAWTNQVWDGTEVVTDPDRPPPRPSPRPAQPATSAWSPPVGSSDAGAAAGTGDGPGSRRAEPATPEPGAAARSISFGRIGAAARTRPRPNMDAALGGAGGALVVFGLTTLAASSNRGGAVAIALVLLAVAFLVHLRAPTAQVTLRAAAVGMAVTAIPAVVLVALDDRFARAEMTVPLLLITLAYVAAWALPGFQGRPVFLGLGVTTAVLLASSATAERRDPFRSPQSPFDDAVFQVESFVAMQGWALLVCSAVCLLFTWQLDRRGYRGAGTAFAAPALVAAPVGFGFVVADTTSPLGVGVALTALGLVVAAVGSHGDRRATTWGGVVLAVLGVVAIAVDIPSDPLSSQVGLWLAVGGAALVAGPLAVRAARANAARPPLDVDDDRR